MATYVTSDAHGHLRALDRALELAQPGSEDAIFVLGDMIDRGPDPAGVLKLVRSLPGARVLMGNHEKMMLQALSGDGLDELTWHMNGGYVTAQALDALPAEEARELMDWIAGLPAFEVAECADCRTSAASGARRAHILCHAGIDALALRGYLATAGVVPSDATCGELRSALAAQAEEDLLWIRDEFWGRPTGLVGPDGVGPVVVAGHTPSILLRSFAGGDAGLVVDESGCGIVAEVGACADTGGVPDKIDVDCSAAAGSPFGQVGVFRLEDRRMWCAPVEEGE